MSEPIKNRYDFVILFDVENGNPNGDPDAGNMPRIDPETNHGIVTDVCLKRKIRNFVETACEDQPGYRIYIKDNVPLNKSDREAFTALNVDEKKLSKKDNPDLDGKIRDFMCREFFDIRTFGAVMTTFVKAALNCGQVRGPVQLGFAAVLIRSCSRRSPSPAWPSPQRPMQSAKARRWAVNLSSPMRFTGWRALYPPI